MTHPLRTRLVQLEVRPGYPRANTAAMLAHIEKACQSGVELIVFPEMAVPGYLIGDEWERDAFLRECERCTDRLVEASQGLAVVFGNVAVDRKRHNEDGRVRKYNALFAAENGRLVAPEGTPYPFVIKTLMPNYRQFDDSRHFFDTRKLALERGVALETLIAPIPLSRVRLGGMLCEDGWDLDYAHSPMEVLAAKACQLFVNISASPFTFNKDHKRNRVFNAAAKTHGRPIAYTNLVGIQNNGKTLYTFDGATCIYDGHGHQVALDTPFEPGVLDAEIPLKPGASFGSPVSLRANDMADLHHALEFGAREFLRQLGIERVTIGVSGGIDSALAAALFARITGPENLLLINMPSRYNSPTTRGLAAQLAGNIGAWFAEIPIEESVNLTRHQIDGLEISLPLNEGRQQLALTPFMLENVQARDRSSRLLAAAGSAFGGVFTCNANKSEITVGYGTLYGDICGFLALLADLWKTEVWELARYLNDHVFDHEIIPRGTIDLVPSAELSDEQNVDAGCGDPLIYPYHDPLFRSWVEWWNRATPEDTLDAYARGVLEDELGYAGKITALFPTTAAFIADVERWWNLYQGMALAKRIQAPPILAVKRRAFGFDHRESQLGARYTERYEALKSELLAKENR